jgi:hypothetical protein
MKPSEIQDFREALKRIGTPVLTTALKDLCYKRLKQNLNDEDTKLNIALIEEELRLRREKTPND